MTTTGIEEVARHAGVSIGTVSNVLNRPDLVSEKTRERVREAIAELGYVRNDTARQVRAGLSRQIAIVVLDLTNPFSTDVMCGAEAAVENGSVVCSSPRSTTCSVASSPART
jgi:LacI family transcriptional regulator